MASSSAVVVETADIKRNLKLISYEAKRLLSQKDLEHGEQLLAWVSSSEVYLRSAFGNRELAKLTDKASSRLSRLRARLQLPLPEVQRNSNLVQSRSAERVTLAVRSEPLSSIDSSLPQRFHTQADEACHQHFESHQEQTFGGLKDKLLR